MKEEIRLFRRNGRSGSHKVNPKNESLEEKKTAYSDISAQELARL